MTPRGTQLGNTVKSSANFIEYKGSPYKNSMKKIELAGLNSDLKDTTNERIREEGGGSVSKQSYAAMSVSSREKIGILESARKTA